jgi:hypothetical protein
MKTTHQGLAVPSMVAALALIVGCDSALKTSGTPPAGGATGSAQTGGAPGVGGISGGGGIRDSGGTSGNGASAGSSGAVGTGGSPSDGGSSVRSCSQDGGRGLPSAARGCAQDSDCQIEIAPNCCSPEDAYGVAVSQAGAYQNCFLRIGLCGMVCAGNTKYYGYATDTGRITPEGSSGAMPIHAVAVHCVNQLCTTDVVDTVDGGQDAAVLDAPAADSVPDSGQTCGDAACGPGQACALIGGGPVPPCEAATDAGSCSDGLVLVASCSGYGAAIERRPGCSTPPPSPKCYAKPDACTDFCSCLCGYGGAGCFRTGAYFTCALP